MQQIRMQRFHQHRKCNENTEFKVVNELIRIRLNFITAFTAGFFTSLLTLNSVPNNGYCNFMQTSYRYLKLNRNIMLIVQKLI